MAEKKRGEEEEEEDDEEEDEEEEVGQLLFPRAGTEWAETSATLGLFGHVRSVQLNAVCPASVLLSPHFW